MVVYFVQDGLVCVFDLSSVVEEEALMAVKNTHSSVVSLVCFHLVFWPPFTISLSPTHTFILLFVFHSLALYLPLPLIEVVPLS